jgi:hypothetical protein
MDVRAKDARFWLHYGPGKESPGNPGWSAMAKPAPPSARTLHFLLDPEFLALLSIILQELAPYPEARQAILRAVDRAHEWAAKQA